MGLAGTDTTMRPASSLRGRGERAGGGEDMETHFWYRPDEHLTCQFGRADGDETKSGLWPTEDPGREIRLRQNPLQDRYQR